MSSIGGLNPASLFIVGLGTIRRAIEENAEFGPLESRLTKFGVDVDNENTAGFIKLMKSFLSLGAQRRPSASKALEDPILELGA